MEAFIIGHYHCYCGILRFFGVLSCFVVFCGIQVGYFLGSEPAIHVVFPPFYALSPLYHTLKCYPPLRLRGSKYANLTNFVKIDRTIVDRPIRLFSVFKITAVRHLGFSKIQVFSSLLASEGQNASS